MKNKESCRLILDMKQYGIHVFGEFGRYNYVNAQTILPQHTHPDMIEICYLSKGRQSYIVGEQTYRVFGGDIFITFPNEVHGTGNELEEKGVLYWIQLKKPEPGETFLGLNYTMSKMLFFRLLQLPKRLFHGEAECEYLLQKIFSVYYQNKDPLTVVELNNLCVSFLLLVIHCGENIRSRHLSDRISQIIHYINGNLFELLELEELAERCNLSVSRFKHLFKEETGIPPSEYIIRKKIEKAQELMKEQKYSIKNIAYDLGFSSPAYFSSVFKQYTGYSPISYKMKE